MEKRDTSLIGRSRCFIADYPFQCDPKLNHAQIRENLTGAVLCHFCSDGVEPARQMALRGLNELRRILVGVSTLMDISFPELEKWKNEEREHDEIVNRWMNAWSAPAPTSTARPTRTPSPAPKSKTPAFDNVVDPAPVQPIVAKEKAGRNDPCPCGSGKKYKKCCLKKNSA
jgi:hypothetical protein